MRSASRQSIKSGVEALRLTAAVDIAAGEQLLFASRVLGSSKQLTSALVDPSATATRKSELLHGLFGTSVEGVAFSLLNSVVDSVWSEDRDLVEGVEQIGIRAIAVASKQASTIQSELLDFGRVVTRNPSLELALGSKLGDPAAKSAIVTTLLDGRANAGTVAILAHLVAAPRGRRIGELVSQAADAVADQFGTVVATVSVASPLDEDQISALVAKLNVIFDASVVVDQHVDASLLGGVRVRVGDKVIDASVAKRLKDLRLQLVG